MFVAGSAVRRGTAVALLAAAAGCYQSSAPPGWLPFPIQAQRDAFGSWIRLQGQPKTLPLAEGELIAIDADSIHVLADGRLLSLARATLCCAELAAYRADLTELQAWSAVGTLSTASHGFFLVFTAPAWLLAGVSATSSASLAPRILSTDPIVLRAFARFPQGIPPGLDRTTLRSKPVQSPASGRLPQ
jgi:hypothetical protein